MTWVGAPSSGGLALPDAHPTAVAMYGPRGVYLDERYLIVADTGNHRVLIWQGVPRADQQPADVVLGQESFQAEGPNARGADVARGLHMPTAVGVVAGNLVVADSWNHRLVFYDGVPRENFARPAGVIGQADLLATERNRGGERDGRGLYWPYGFLADGERFFVFDTGNRRVLGWNRMPWAGESADFVLGQADFGGGEENRGAAVSARGLRWPHAGAVFAGRLWVADAGNHRVLGWRREVDGDEPAEMVLGQPDFTSNAEFVLARQSERTLRFPYGLAAGPDWLAVADTANNRVVGYSAEGLPVGAWVMGQKDFAANGENHWKAVGHDTLCWPYGLASHDGQLAVADSGNNRVMLWPVPARREEPIKQCA